VQDVQPEEQGGEAVADDPVCPRSVGDGVVPERAGAGDEERKDGCGEDSGAGRGRLLQRLPRDSHRQQHHGEEGEGDQGELLERDRGAEAGGRPHEPAPAQQPEGEHQRQERRGVGGAEPGAADKDRVRREHGSDREPPFERAGKQQRGRQQRERRQQDEEPVVVEGAR